MSDEDKAVVGVLDAVEKDNDENVMGDDNDDDSNDDENSEDKEYSKEDRAKIGQQLVNAMNELREEASSMGINPDSRAGLNFLRNLDPNYNAKKNKLDPSRNGEAIEDYYAFMASRPVVDWVPGTLTPDKQIDSYKKQIMDNEGEFGFNFEPEQKRRRSHIPYFIYTTPDATKLFGEFTPSTMKKSLTPFGVRIKLVKFLKPGQLYDMLPMKFDGANFYAEPDTEFQKIIPPLPYAMIAVPLTEASAFERFLNSRDSDIEGFMAAINTPLVKRDEYTYLISENAYPQTIHNYQTHKGEGEIEGGRDCFRTEKERQARIMELKRTIAKDNKNRALPLSRAAPYNLELADKYFESRKKKLLPKYITRLDLPRESTDYIVSRLDEFKKRLAEFAYLKKAKKLDRNLLRKGMKNKKKKSKRAKK